MLLENVVSRPIKKIFTPIYFIAVCCLHKTAMESTFSADVEFNGSGITSVALAIAYGGYTWSVMSPKKVVHLFAADAEAPIKLFLERHIPRIPAKGIFPMFKRITASKTQGCFKAMLEITRMGINLVALVFETKEGCADYIKENVINEVVQREMLDMVETMLIKWCVFGMRELITMPQTVRLDPASTLRAPPGTGMLGPIIDFLMDIPRGELPRVIMSGKSKGSSTDTFTMRVFHNGVIHGPVELYTRAFNHMIFDPKPSPVKNGMFGRMGNGLWGVQSLNIPIVDVLGVKELMQSLRQWGGVPLFGNFQMLIVNGVATDVKLLKDADYYM